MLHVTVTFLPVVPTKQIREKIAKYVQKSGENKAMKIRVVNNLKMKKMIFFNVPVIGFVSAQSYVHCMLVFAASLLLFVTCVGVQVLALHVNELN